MWVSPPDMGDPCFTQRFCRHGFSLAGWVEWFPVAWSTVNLLRHVSCLVWVPLPLDWAYSSSFTDTDNPFCEGVGEPVQSANIEYESRNEWHQVGASMRWFRKSHCNEQEFSHFVDMSFSQKICLIVLWHSCDIFDSILITCF